MSIFRSNNNNSSLSNNNDLFIRGLSAGNTSRNSGRNKYRFSAENKDSCENEKLYSNKPYLTGHSRAASADISTGVKDINLPNQITNLATVITSRTSHHIRNNSVDNSLVNSSFPVKTTGIRNMSQINNKPAVPAKPAIVSVFVPGSTVTVTPTTISSNSKNTGNTYSNVKCINRPHSIQAPITNYLNNPNPGDDTYPVPPPRKVFCF